MAANPDTLANEPLVVRRDRDGIATLTLNRPEKFNALSVAMLTALQDEFDALAGDRSVHVIVLAGSGKAFCAGHDLGEMRNDSSPQAIAALFAQCSRMMVSMTRLPQPVSARVHGIATAAGCQLVAHCDLAVASEEARFATSGINVGLFCATPMVAVTRNLPRKQAMEMLMTGAFIDAPTAREYGLVNRVVPADALDGAVAELAGEIATKAPQFIAEGKRLFYRQIEADLEHAYDEANDVMTANMQTEDARTGIDAFLAKRPMPKWKGR